ncbi:FecR family protein [Aestuariibaculum sp. M13]|uniref:FecR family protein n=1 Tax=Aestuariibaculum sp. M13 TaxID=2967132 RepID=UPI002159D067|nr:FecR family protein [Aestuariibaculum sp. M13]MCR8668710.1 FecR family protein [Aestuariibaculum sp. M13]
MEEKIEKLVVKFLNKTATQAELKLVSDWLENPKNMLLFRKIVDVHVAIIPSMTSPKTERTVELFLKQIGKKKNKVFQINNFKYFVAASIILLFGVVLFFKYESQSNRQILNNRDSQVLIEQGSNKAILTLENGTQMVLEKGTSINTVNASSDGKQIVYSSSESLKKVKYNYLTIPRGGQFQLVLSDGTKVWLNSESKLKYPVSFNKGKNREVELIYGEAYFDVISSRGNNIGKFLVKNQYQEVEVLGTEFNIKAYPDESDVYTTLVEGKVLINYEGETHTLKPNQQAKLDIQTKEVLSYKVDVKRVISWKDGIFSFTNNSLKDIMRVISRWYDVDVVFVNSELETVMFKGSLDKNQSIQNILSIMKSTSINDYSIMDRTVYLE